MSTATAVEPPPQVSESSREGPYVGLRTYEEKDANRYFGREDIVAELARMVKRAQLTVLFGVSGTGKSSMIRAGLFPIVRSELHLPVLIRLDFTGSQRDLRAQVRERIIAELDEHNVDTKRPTEGTSFRDYFVRNPWWSTRNKLLTPFLVFDQFEEIFTIGRDHAEDVSVLMNELAELVERPSLESDAQVDIVTPRPRVMLALREDFLAHLEDFRVRMPSLLGNRMRLTRMNGTQALKAVLEPARGLVTEATARKIVRFVAAGAAATEKLDDPEEEARHPLESLEVEPAILSLVCEQLDVARRAAGLPTISDDLIKKQGGKIVERFYEEAFKDVAPEVRALVEEHLVTNDGYRTTMAKTAALETDGVTGGDLKKLLDKKILREEVRFGGALHIELIHDRLTRIASVGRARRREEEHERMRAAKWRRRLQIAGAIAAVVILVVAFWLRELSVRRRSDLEHAHQEAQRVARVLVGEARDALLRGDPVRAVDRVLRAGRYFRDAKTTEPPESLLLLNRALVALSGRIQSIDHGSTISCVRVFGDREVLTCGADGSLRAWHDQKATADFGAYDGPPVAASYPAHSAEWVLVLRNDGSGEQRNPSAKAAIQFRPPGNRVLTAQNSIAPMSAQSKSGRPKAPIAPTAQQVAQHGSELDATFEWRACIAPDDSAFAVWSPQVYGVRTWDVRSGMQGSNRWLDTAQASEVQCLSRNQFLVVTVSHDIVLIDAAGIETRIPTGIGNNNIAAVAASADGTSIAVAASELQGDRVLVLDRDHAWAPRPTLRPPSVAGMELSADGKHLLTTARQRERTFVGVWDTQDGSLRFAIERPSAAAHLRARGAMTVLVVASGHDVEAWNADTGKLLGTTSFDFELGSALLDLGGDGTHYLVAAASANMASLRKLEEAPAWSDQRLVSGAEGWGTWSLGWLSSEYTRSQRDAGAARLVFENSALVLRDRASHELGRMSVPDDFIDIRIAAGTQAHPGACVALLDGHGQVMLLDDKLAPIALLSTLPVREIRWTTQQELITLGWSQTQVWSCGGRLLETVPVGGDAATVVYQPRRALWICKGTECTAWDGHTQQRLAHMRFDGAAGVEIEPTSIVATAIPRPAGGAVLLPVVSADPNLLEPGPVTHVASLGSNAIASYETGNSYAWLSSASPRRIATGPARPVIVDGMVIGANASSLFWDPLAAPLVGTNHPLYATSTPIIAIRATKAAIAVANSVLGLSLLERSADGANQIASASTDLVTSGSNGTFSRLGDRYAMVSQQGDIEVRSIRAGTTSGTYDARGLNVRALLVPDSTTSVVAAVTDKGLAIWKGLGKPSHLQDGLYRSAILDGAGTYLLALRVDNHVEVFRIENGTLRLLKVMSGVSMALDAKGTRIAIADGDGHIDIYTLDDLAHRKNRHNVRAPSAPTIVFSPPAGKYMWIPVEHKIRRVFEQGGDSETELEAAADCVFAGDGDRAACVFVDPESVGEDNVYLTTIEVPSGNRVGSPFKMPRSPDRVIACSSADEQIGLALVNGDTATIVALDPRLGHSRTAVAHGVTGCSLSGTNAWTITESGFVQRWDMRAGIVVEARGGARILDMVPGRDALHAAIAIPNQDLRVTRIAKGTTENKTLPDSRDVAHAVFIGEKELACGVTRAGNHEVLVWSLPIGSVPARKLDSARSPVSNLAVLGTHQMLAAAHEDGVVEVWDVGTVKPRAVLPGYGTPARTVVIDDAERWIATSYDDGSIGIWALEDPDTSGRREPLVRLAARGQPAGAPVIAFERGDPAPALLAGNPDGSVQRWTLGGELPADARSQITDALLENLKRPH